MDDVLNDPATLEFGKELNSCGTFEYARKHYPRADWPTAAHWRAFDLIDAGKAATWDGVGDWRLAHDYIANWFERMNGLGQS